MENLFHLQFDIKQVNAISAVGLAHIGDGVYELLCRSHLCVQGDKTLKNLHNHTISLVKAPTQAKLALSVEPLLTEEEQAIYRRGKNAHTHAHPKSATAKEYALATGLEALFGALYLLGRQSRILELFSKMMEVYDGL